MQSLMLILCALSGCSGILWAAVCMVRSVQFDRDCTGRLKRAANAITVEIAARELGVVLNYLVLHGLTKGWTSVFYNTPDEDIGYWYRNLKHALAELQVVPAEASMSERTGLLLKLRGTVLDHGAGGGDEVTVPDGLSLYPYNALFGAWGLMSFVSFLLFGVASVFVR